MKTPIQVALLDFDGTLVTRDILDVLCGLMGKEQESYAINAAFNRGELTGVAALCARINFLKGMTRAQIVSVLSKNNYLMPGAVELMEFFRANHITTILASGNILPVLEYYQNLLGIDYLVGSVPRMDGETIMGIDESAFTSKSFKIDGIQRIIRDLNAELENIVAIGDSPSDKRMFTLSGFSIAINPKGDIADSASTVIHDDLREAVRLLSER